MMMQPRAAIAVVFLLLGGDGRVAACTCPSGTTDQNGMFTSGCDCELNTNMIWESARTVGPNGQISVDSARCNPEASPYCLGTVSYSSACEEDHGYMSVVASHTDHGSGLELTCACSSGYSYPEDGSSLMCTITEDEQDRQESEARAEAARNMIQNLAPDQSCDLQLYFLQSDCSGDPDVSGDCVETIKTLVDEAGAGADAAVALFEGLSGTSTSDICTSMCSQGCYGVLGWALWFYSPCIADEGSPAYRLAMSPRPPPTSCPPPLSLLSVREWSDKPCFLLAIDSAHHVDGKWCLSVAQQRRW